MSLSPLDYYVSTVLQHKGFNKHCSKPYILRLFCELHKCLKTNNLTSTWVEPCLDMDQAWIDILWYRDKVSYSFFCSSIDGQLMFFEGDKEQVYDDKCIYLNKETNFLPLWNKIIGRNIRLVEEVIK